MHQDSNGDPPQRVEGAQDVHGGGGVETEDCLPTIQYYEGLKHREEQDNWCIVVVVVEWQQPRLRHFKQ